jgi:hypothetical protein
MGSGSVKYEGLIKQRGVCWGTTHFPKVTDFFSWDQNPGPGSFSVEIFALEPNTRYWVRAYAFTDVGNVYGDTVSFTTPEVKLGQTLLNGTVFFIDSAGHHGLIAAPADQGVFAWSAGTNLLTNAVSETDGLTNSGTISDVQGNGTYAATACMDYESNGVFYIWFLPSKAELDLLYKNKSHVSGLLNGSYWSSTENSLEKAWAQDFANGNQSATDKTSNLNVRAVRAF